jgi:hypothetical protein
MFGMSSPYLPPLLGVLIWLTICFQVVLGLRWIRLGRVHFKVHKWIGIALVVLGPLHGLWATSLFLGWPFRIV